MFAAILPAATSRAPADPHAGRPSAAVEEVANLFPYGFRDANGDGQPDGFSQDRESTASVSCEDDPAGGAPTVRIALDEQGSGSLDSARFTLERNQAYLFTIEVKVTDMRFQGEIRHIDHAIVFYIHAADGDRHMAAWINGRGSSPGWATLILPFSTKTMPELTSVRVLLRCYSIAGTIWFRNLAIVALPRGTRIDRVHFVLENGRAAEMEGLLR